MNLVVAGIEAKTDADGRYCLKDFHKAAGGEAKHRPSLFSRSEGFSAMVADLSAESCLAPAATVKGGKTPGTYVAKELVYAYAMWVSPKFHLHVIRTYDQVAQAQAIKAQSELAIAIIKLGKLQKQVGYMTLQQYRAMSGVRWPRKMNNSLGMLLAAKCAKEGLAVRRFNQNGWMTDSYPRTPDGTTGRRLRPGLHPRPVNRRGSPGLPGDRRMKPVDRFPDDDTEGYVMQPITCAHLFF